MSHSSVSDVKPVRPLHEEFVTDYDIIEPDKSQGSSPNNVVRFARFVGGIIRRLWVWLVGAFLCMNFAVGGGVIFNFLGGILVFGWTYRWMQAVVLKRWWKRSAFANEGTFREFLDQYGPEGPVALPQWFVREKPKAALEMPRKGNSPNGFRVFLRVLTIPWHSAWLNFKLGFLGLFCTFLVTGWGCLLMVFGWEIGWIISFNKMYELSWIGVTVSLIGIFLFAFSLIYVLMAQVHQAVTGQARAFFEFKFIWKLIWVRLTAYVFLVSILGIVSLPLEVMKSIPFVANLQSNNEALTDAEALAAWRQHWFLCCLVFFPLLLFVRGFACRFYSSAVLESVRRGLVPKEELHPDVKMWLDRMEICPEPVNSKAGILKFSLRTAHSFYQLFWLGLIFVILVLFTFKTYVGQFFSRQHEWGFWNHPLVQIPSFDYTPWHLKDAVEGEKEE